MLRRFRNPDEIRHYWTGKPLPAAKKRIKFPANGFIIYEGPSLYDREPIVAIATGFIRPSRNPKTGPMIQISIMRADIHPQDAIRSGEDKSVCGRCIHRGVVETVPSDELAEHREPGTQLSSERSCYVTMSHIWTIWNSYRRGEYPKLAPEEIAITFGSIPYPPRFGDYGDPAMVPLWVWQEVVKLRDKWTGYTSQWRLKRVQLYKLYLQASVNSYEEYKEAKELGWRTYRTGRICEPLLEGEEIYCPETPEGGGITVCGACTLCMGTSRLAPDILTRPTGKGVRFHEERGQARHYSRNPKNKDVETIRGILKDLTPCDKRAWGLRRFNPRRTYRKRHFWRYQ